MGEKEKKRKKSKSKVMKGWTRKGVRRQLVYSSDSEADHRAQSTIVHYHDVVDADHDHSSDSGSVSDTSRPPTRPATPLPPPERKSRSPTRTPRSSRSSRSCTPTAPRTPPPRLSPPSPPTQSPGSSRFSGPAALSPSVLSPAAVEDETQHEDGGVEDPDDDGDHHDNEVQDDDGDGVQGDDEEEEEDGEVEHEPVEDLIQQSDKDDGDDSEEVMDQTAVEYRLNEEYQNRSAQYAVSNFSFYLDKFSLIFHF